MAAVVSNPKNRHGVPARLWLALVTGCGALWAGESPATIMEINRDHYVVSVEKPHADYFSGKLLTANDLNQEQSYRNSGKRYLPRTDLPFDELLQAEGFADVVLLFDEADALNGSRTDVTTDDRFGDDFIVLDTQRGRWRGRLFLEVSGDIQQGVYDDLSGSYRGFTPVSEPSSLLLCLVALVGLSLLRPKRTR